MRVRLFLLLLFLAGPLSAQTTPNLHLNIPAHNTPNWDVLLNQNFNILDGVVMPGTSISLKCLNNICFADQWGSVQAAVNALPAAGGTVIVPAGYTETVTSPWIIGGASKVVTLNIDKTATITFNVTGGVDAVQLWSKSAIISEGTNSLTNQLILASTANVNNFIANYPRTGGSIFNLRGLTIQGNALATMAGALVDLASVVDNSTISNTVIGQCMNGYGLRIQNTSGGSVGPLNLDNLTVNCNAQTGSKPVLINAAFTNGVISNINFIGGSLVHPGTGGLSIVDIEGGTNNQIQGVSFIGTQFESSNLADIGVNAVNTAGLSMVGTVFTAAVNAGTSCVKLSQSGGITQNIHIDNLTNFNGWTNTIQDAINTVNITDARIGRYSFLPSSPAGSSYVYGSSGLVNQISPTVNLWGKGFGADGAGFKHKRIASPLGGTCPTGAVAGNACTSANINWTTAFPDNNYTLTCTLNNATNQPHLVQTTKLAAGAGFTITIATDLASAANAGADCIAVHD